MLLTCPACSTRYMTDEASFSPHGRTVRCARCGHSWFQAPANGASGEFSGGLSGAMAVPQLMRPEAVMLPRKSGIGVPLLILAVLLFFAGAAGVYQYRDAVVQAVPQLQGILGSPAPVVVPSALDIRNVKIAWVDPEEKTQLKVWGEIINLGQDTVSLPPLRFSFTDAEGKEMFGINKPPQQIRLTPATAGTFAYTLDGLPPGAANITVDFVAAGAP